MSSYVINSDVYQKVAGCVFALTSTSGGTTPAKPLWLYGATKDKTAEDFAKLFLLNAHSVQKQYRDSTPQPRETEGKETMAFQAGLHLGQRLAEASETGYVLWAIAKFLNSVFYQIEDEEDEKKAHRILAPYIWAILVAVEEKQDWKMPKPSYDSLTDCWGNFELDPNYKQ